MAGGNAPPKASSHKPHSSHRKSRWQSGNDPPANQKPSASTESKLPAPPSSKPTYKPSDTNANIKRNNDRKSNPSPSPSHPKPTPERAPPPGPHLPFPEVLGRPPPPAYGFHMLERRTIMLADGSVRSYFALPLDYQDFTPLPRPLLPRIPDFPGPGLGFDRQFPAGGPLSPGFRPEFGGLDDRYMRGRNQDHLSSLGLDGRGSGPLPGPRSENLLKRKFSDEVEGGRREEHEETNGFERQRQQLLQYGSLNGYPNGRGDLMAGTSSPYMGRVDDMRASKIIRTSGGYENFQGSMGLRNNEVDQRALRKAFFHFSKLVNENVDQKKNYLADGKQGPVQCVVCGRSSKDFLDMHGLLMHLYNSDSIDLRVDHLALYKALCILMGWNYLIHPDNSKAYQILSANEAAENQDDLIMWPPIVIIHNTATGKSRDGRMEGLGNKAMDGKLRDLGFGIGKAKSLYGRDGHLGVTLVKFADDQSGLKEAIRLAEFFEKENCGRNSWTRVHSMVLGKDGDNNPHLVRVDMKTGERHRIFYGYLGTVKDLDKVDLETRKKVVIESRRDRMQS